MLEVPAGVGTIVAMVLVGAALAVYSVGVFTSESHPRASRATKAAGWLLTLAAAVLLLAEVLT